MPLAPLAALFANHSKKPDSSKMADKKVMEKKRAMISKGFMAVGAVNPLRKVVKSRFLVAKTRMAPKKGGIQKVSIEKERKVIFG